MQKPIVRILGIDASTRNIGWAFISYDRENLIGSGVIHLAANDFYERLGYGPRQMSKTIKGLMTDDTNVLVIENSFFTTNAEIGKKISMVVGACVCVMKPQIPKIQEIAPSEWKKASTGSGKSDKDQIRAWVKRQFGLSITSEDECDAIGIALGYIRLEKSGHFEAKKAEKAAKRKRAAAKRAAKKAVETEQPLKGELELCP